MSLATRATSAIVDLHEGDFHLARARAHALGRSSFQSRTRRGSGRDDFPQSRTTNSRSTGVSQRGKYGLRGCPVAVTNTLFRSFNVKTSNGNGHGNL